MDFKTYNIIIEEEMSKKEIEKFQVALTTEEMWGLRDKIESKLLDMRSDANNILLINKLLNYNKNLIYLADELKAENNLLRTKIENKKLLDVVVRYFVKNGDLLYEELEYFYENLLEEIGDKTRRHSFACFVDFENYVFNKISFGDDIRDNMSYSKIDEILDRVKSMFDLEGSDK